MQSANEILIEDDIKTKVSYLKSNGNLTMIFDTQRIIFQDDMNKYLCEHSDTHDKQLEETNKCLREQIKKLETDLHTYEVIQEEMCEQMNQYELQNNIIKEQIETTQQLFKELEDKFTAHGSNTRNMDI